LHRTVTSCAATAQGARGIGVDGVITDILELWATKLPVFARGTSLLTTKLRSDSASAQNIEIECGGTRVVLLVVLFLQVIYADRRDHFRFDFSWSLALPKNSTIAYCRKRAELSP
jgi:regulator of RNase E activity RraA